MKNNECIHFQPTDCRRHNYQFERLLGRGSQQSGSHSQKSLHNQPRHLGYLRLLYHHAVNHAQANTSSQLELWKQPLQDDRVS